MFSIILVLAFISIKHKSTRLTDDSMIQILAINLVIVAVTQLSVRFGSCGFNPALACGYISFAVSQYAYPNVPDLLIYKNFRANAESVNHYLWVYMVAPMVGGFVAGVLHLVHSKCANVKGKDNDVNVSVDADHLIE